MTTNVASNGWRRTIGRAGAAVTALLVAAGCGAGSSTSPAADVTTTLAATPAEILADGPGEASFSNRNVLSDLLRDLPSVDGVTWRGAYPNGDAGNVDLGFPPEPCTPSQRLAAEEFGPYEVAGEGFRLDDDSGRGGVRLIWFDSDTEAAAYAAAYSETCAAYETQQQGGSVRGIERTISVEQMTELDPRLDETWQLTSSWRATVNDLGWGGDIVYSTTIGNVVLESTLFVGASPEGRIPEAQDYFLVLVDHVQPELPA